MGHERQTGTSVRFKKVLYLAITVLQSNLMIFTRNLEEMYKLHNY